MSVIMFPGPGRPWVALRPCVTPDYMTVRPPRIPGEMTWDYFDWCWRMIRESRVVCEHGGVGGLVLDCTNKPPATYEWE